MGYMSKHELYVTPSKEFNNVRKYIEENYSEHFERSGVMDEPSKWYTLKDDLRNCSRAFPEVLICVERHGEDDEDFERLYAKNGDLKSTRPELVWPDPPDFK